MVECFVCGEEFPDLVANSVCDACFIASMDEFFKLKDEYDQMIFLGVSHEKALEIILKRAGLED